MEYREFFLFFSPSWSDREADKIAGSCRTMESKRFVANNAKNGNIYLVTFNETLWKDDIPSTTLTTLINSTAFAVKLNLVVVLDLFLPLTNYLLLLHLSSFLLPLLSLLHLKRLVERGKLKLARLNLHQRKPRLKR